jgi:hypothetical protein
MKTLTSSLKLVPLLLLALGVFTGCESTDGGSGGTSATTMYYGVGISDPYYYGAYDNDPDIIVTPPRQGDRTDTPPPPEERPDRPDRPMPPPRPEQPIARPEPRPEQPIARPTPEPRPSAQPMPSIPSAPRPSPRR